MRPRERFKLMNYASSIYKINLTTYFSCKYAYKLPTEQEYCSKTFNFFYFFFPRQCFFYYFCGGTEQYWCAPNNLINRHMSLA